MKIKYLRILDKYLGFLISLSLCILKIFIKTNNSFGKQRINKILIIKFWGFGSVILAYKFFQAIRKEFPQAYICALTLKENSQVFEITGLFDEIIDIDIGNLFHFSSSIIKIISRLRKKSFDISFDLEFSSRFSGIASCLINAKKRIGFQYDGVWRGGNFTNLLHFQETTKLSDSYFKMSNFIREGIDIPLESLKLNIGSEQKAFVDYLLEKELLRNKNPIIGINIYASELCLMRRWPKEYFVALAEELIKLYSSHIIFIGSVGDFNYVDTAINLINYKARSNVHNFAGKTSLRQLVYLMSKFRLFISNDSGPLHLAVYLRIPSISFFGPEAPLIYGPEGESGIVFYRNLSCSPCIRIKNYKSVSCNNNRCLKDIKPYEVLDEIRRKKLL